mmetsp:Transcript_26934/g.23726  ORF Transcript_26934/g.23726 Transcript_26934/m.23726 type:complete len:105 (+) Transcript_26934:63-377(+)
MASNYILLTIAFLFVLLSIVYGDYNNYEAYAYEDEELDSDQSSQNGGVNMVGYDEDGSGYVTVSLYGLLIWQFMSLSFGMCLCGGISMCYNRFSQPNKVQQTQW